jgi:hypothetical protein
MIFDPPSREYPMVAYRLRRIHGKKNQLPSARLVAQCHFSERINKVSVGDIVGWI